MPECGREPQVSTTYNVVDPQIIDDTNETGNGGEDTARDVANCGPRTPASVPLARAQACAEPRRLTQRSALRVAASYDLLGDAPSRLSGTTRGQAAAAQARGHLAGVWDARRADVEALGHVGAHAALRAQRLVRRCDLKSDISSKIIEYYLTVNQYFLSFPARCRLR